MREGIHPNYVQATVTCACGNTFATRSTKPVIRLEICSACHPFFSGKQKFIDTAGRVERFQKRFAKTSGETVKKDLAPAMAKGQKAALSKKKAKIMRSAPLIIPKKVTYGKDAAAVTAKPGAKPADKAPAKAS